MGSPSTPLRTGLSKGVRNVFQQPATVGSLAETVFRCGPLLSRERRDLLFLSRAPIAGLLPALFVPGPPFAYHSHMPAAVAIDRFLDELRGHAVAFYGERLVSLAVFGSHASGRARPNSDLDLLLVLTAAAPRRRLRLDEFDQFEEALAAALEAVEREGWSIELSPVIRTRDEAEGFSILYLDMTVDVRILFDREEFLRWRLDRMRTELQRLGAQRRTLGTRWYWVLKKDYRPGEVFEIS